MLFEPSSAPGGQPIRIDSPSSLAVAVPHLLGFHPSSSAVVVLAAAGLLRLTVRADLPGSSPARWARDMVSRMRAANADRAYVVIYPAGDPSPIRAPRLPARAQARALTRALERSGIEVADSLCVSEGRWWSYLCDDPRCCDPDGQPVDEQAAEAIAASFAEGGATVLPSRESLAELLCPAPGDEREIGAALDRQCDALERACESGQEAIEAWRDQAITTIEAGLLLGIPPSIDDCAAMVAGLRDVRVRDVVLFDLAAMDVSSWACARDALLHVVRRCPAGDIAPVATALAVVSWQIGDGALATVALDLALAHEPDYTLGQMVAAAIQGGLPPGAWLATMRDTTRDACRHGASGAKGSGNLKAG